MKKERKIFEETQKRQSSFNETQILKKENDFLKVELNKNKKEMD